MATKVNDKSRQEDASPLRIRAKVLAGAMKGAAAVLQNANTIPILSNVRLAASGETLDIATSDLDTEYRQTLPLEGPCELAVTVDAKRLYALAIAVDGDAIITMALKDGRLSISAGRSRWQLPILPADDFPIMPATKYPHGTAISGDDLARTINRVAWAISSEVTRYYLCGAYFHSVDGVLSLVATDGTAASFAKTPAALADDAAAIIVPEKFLRLLATVSAGHEVTLAWDERKIRASFGDTVLTGKTIDGAFPDYRRVVPAIQPSPVIFDPERVREALQRVNIVTDKTTRGIKIARGDGSIALAAASGDGGEAGEEIPADAADGFQTGVNGSYLASALASIGGDSIELHQADAGSPMLIRRVVDDGAFAIVMPMRV